MTSSPTASGRANATGAGGRMRKLVAVASLVVALVCAVFITHHVRSYQFQKGIVPEAITLKGFFSYWSATHGCGTHGCCGAAVFKIAPETLSAIRERGLGFFDGMLTSRNGKQDLGSWSIGEQSTFRTEGREGVPKGAQ